MRIVAGKYKGRRLEVPKNNLIRPTSDKVRGAIFNALRSRIDLEGTHILDGFCGTGALGLEALSRGAAHAHFWDNDSTSLNLAKINAQALKAMDHATFLRRDTGRITQASTHKPFDIIFLDPPYHKDLITLSLKGLEEHNYIGNDTICIIETEKNHTLSGNGSHTVHFEKTYGDSHIRIIKY